MALYFETVKFFGFLMLALLVTCGLYPLIHSGQNNELGTEYTVQVRDASSALLGETICTRSAAVSAILGTSVGASCNNEKTASYYSCPTQCLIFLETGETTDLDNLCSAHLPCRNSALTDAEKASCCHETLRGGLTHKMDEGNKAFGLFVNVVVMLIWAGWYHARQMRNAARINAHSVTVGDYAVRVKGLGMNKFTRQQMAEFMSHYGEVASVSYVKNVGKLLAAESVLFEQKMKLAELKAWNEPSDTPGGTLKALSDKKDLAGKQAFLAMFTKSASHSEATIKKMQIKCDGLAAKIEQLAKSPAMNDGEAFVTMNYEKHAGNVLADQRRNFMEVFFEYASCGCFGPPRLGGKRLRLSLAPEPDDINWENITVRGVRWFMLTLNAWLALGVAVTIGALIQQVFERYRNDVRQSTLDKELRAAALGETPEPDDGTLTLLSAVSGFVIVVINIALQKICKKLTAYQRFHTRTHHEASLMAKTFLVTMINTVIIPITASDCKRNNSSKGECLWYAPGGLIESAFYMQLFDAFLPHMKKLIDPKTKARRQLATFAKTQDMCERAMEPPDFVLAEYYADTLKTVALAVIYGPVLPISYLLGFIALCVTYCTDKYIALNKTRKPVRMKSQHAVYVFYAVQLLIFTQWLQGSLGWYSRDEPYLWFALSMIIVLIAYLVTFLQRVLSCKGHEDGGTGGVSYTTNMRTGGGGKAAAKEDDSHEGELSQREKLIKCQLLRISPGDFDKPGRLDMYHPPIGERSDERAKYLVEEYALFAEPVKGNPALMRGQHTHTGRHFVNPPAPGIKIQPPTKVNPNALLSPADVEQGNVRKNQVLPVTG